MARSSATARLRGAAWPICAGDHAMFLSQLLLPGGGRGVALREGDAAHLVPGAESTRDLAQAAIAAGRGLAEEAARRGRGAPVDLAQALAEGRVLPPVDHPDPAHLHLTGTGLTHLGSAATRDAMHGAPDAGELTDSMKMFRMGLEGGKPRPGEAGVQPEWFYKGNGHAAVAPGAPLASPAFALDAGEEPEIAGLYLIGPDGTPFRLGFALGNEFSDHVTERGNYLWLAHSKLRPASFGPEMLLGALPQHVEGSSRILRDGAVLWERPFLSGEANMSHSIANLEHHHFKYALFRQPGDVHVHFFGTATLSFADGVHARPGDVFQIEAPALGLPLRNPLVQLPNDAAPVAVATL
ncbi:MULTISPECIES: AraD1 family protein [Paracoccus]|nr:MULTISPECIES: AraD1 family protein [Paracoccus]